MPIDAQQRWSQEIMFHKLKKELGLDLQKLRNDNIQIPDVFWINDTDLHRKEFERTNGACCFNHQIGLPLHPVTLQQMGLMPYQYEFVRHIPEKRNRLIHINKSRQIGVTELVLRVLAFHCFHKYKGGKIMIIAGTREDTAAKIMARFKQLFKNISWTVVEDTHKLILRLANGTVVEALPSNSDAIRGDTKIRAVFVDEAAHFKLKDDSVVMDAIRPIIFTNKSDLFLVSTPNGRRGFFYDISREENEYLKLYFDYKMAINWIYTQEDIDRELQRKEIDVEQEYMCQFTTTRHSYFGDHFTYGDHEAEDYSNI